MELCKRGDLLHILHREELQLRERLRICYEVGLEALVTRFDVLMTRLKRCEQ